MLKLDSAPVYKAIQIRPAPAKSYDNRDFVYYKRN